MRFFCCHPASSLHPTISWYASGSNPRVGVFCLTYTSIQPAFPVFRPAILRRFHPYSLQYRPTSPANLERLVQILLIVFVRVYMSVSDTFKSHSTQMRSMNTQNTAFDQLEQIIREEWDIASGALERRVSFLIIVSHTASLLSPSRLRGGIGHLPPSVE